MRVYLATLGCRANQYDTEVVRSMILAAGHEVAHTVAGADYAIINSCGVTAGAVADLRQLVRRSARLQPAIRTVVMGCAAASDGNAETASLRALPGVEAVIPGADFQAVAVALGLPDQFSMGRPARQSGARALLRVQDGCDEHCTFCATRLARGRNRSRAPDDLVREAAALSEYHSEIVITGTHIGSYGTDSGSTLGCLLERLVSAFPRVRFRLSSIEATEVDDRLRELLRDAPLHLCPHLHAPLQSGSDVLLRRMGRHWYTARSYERAVEQVVADRPAFGLGADLIVGFPGETDADHRATVSLAERLPFTYLHVFRYSPRPGTSAPRMADGLVSPVAASERAEELRGLGLAKASFYRENRIGGEADVVVTGGRTSEREAVTGDYLTVTANAPARARGTRYRARLERAGTVVVARPLADTVSEDAPGA